MVSPLHGTRQASPPIYSDWWRGRCPTVDQILAFIESSGHTTLFVFIVLERNVVREQGSTAGDRGSLRQRASAAVGPLRRSKGVH